MLAFKGKVKGRKIQETAERNDLAIVNETEGEQNDTVQEIDGDYN